jgi:hypothetical protein
MVNLRFHALSRLPKYYFNQDDELTLPYSVPGIRIGWMCMQHAKKTRVMHAEYLSENMKLKVT